MADKEDVQLFQSGETDLQGCDLSEYAAQEEQHFVKLDFRNCDLKSAKFKKCRFEQCDFRHADIVRTDFSDSTFLNCQFSHMVHTAHFDRSIFQGGTYKPYTVNCTLTDAKFIGVDVNGLRFGDGNLLSGATADEATDFSGVRMTRALSRLPIFKDYSFERGALVRITPSLERPQAPQPAVEEKVGQDLDAVAAKAALRENHNGARLMCLSLSESITDFKINAPIPNDPEQLEYYEGYVSLLNAIDEDLRAIANVLDEQDGPIDEARIDNAAAHILNLRTLLQDWWTQNQTKVVDSSISIGLIGAGTAFLTLCGAPAMMATSISAILGGPKVVSDYIKAKKAG
ncbi:pentapeptide repeat-containing protein [uncultured Hoeflea sp.]|uniref:pentapeptide repeat-containing protein n=1 Tax=uncultured Hoeflea sp. TaxID=538666 RepID=UPI0030DCDE35|tara:strand:- start:117 stop:1145 length:1029 start_codon:yes stop_codon:yes gene_type:complete